MYPSRSLSNKKKKTPRKKKQKTEDSLISTPLDKSLDKRPLLILGELDQWLVEIQATQNFSQQCDQC